MTSNRELERSIVSTILIKGYLNGEHAHVDITDLSNVSIQPSQYSEQEQNILHYLHSINYARPFRLKDALELWAFGKHQPLNNGICKESN